MSWRAWIPESVKQPYRAARSLWRALRRPRIAQCRVSGLVIRVHVATDMEDFRVRTYATKEPETLRWLDDRLRPGDVLVDIGANIGLYSLYAAKREPRCSVYAFEPESQNFASLCRNIVLNGLRNITPCNLPLAEREAFDVFNVGEFTSGSALHSFGAGTPGAPAQVSLRQAALALPLDDLVGRLGLPSPQLVKIDVDGLEERIIRGAARVLATASCRSALIELNFRDESDAARMVASVEAGGLTLIGRSDWAVHDGGATARNFIFDRRAS